MVCFLLIRKERTYIVLFRVIQLLSTLEAKWMIESIHEQIIRVPDECPFKPCDIQLLEEWIYSNVRTTDNVGRIVLRFNYKQHRFLVAAIQRKCAMGVCRECELYITTNDACTYKMRRLVLKGELIYDY